MLEISTRLVAPGKKTKCTLLRSCHRQKFRVIWYLKMAAIENLETQLKGFVSIFYNLGVSEYEPAYLDVMKRVKKALNDSLPYYNVAVHYCFNDARLMGALSILKLVAGRDVRLRFRTHYGMSMFDLFPSG